MSKAKVSAGSPGELTPPGGPPGGPPAEGGAESAPEAYTICVRALSGEATTLEVDGADTIATVKEKFDTALLESDQEPMKGLSLWHENARLDESRTLQSYGVGAGAAIQALATERDVEVELREERDVARDLRPTLRLGLGLSPTPRLDLLRLFHRLPPPPLALRLAHATAVVRLPPEGALGQGPRSLLGLALLSQRGLDVALRGERLDHGARADAVALQRARFVEAHVRGGGHRRRRV